VKTECGGMSVWEFGIIGEYTRKELGCGMECG